MSPLTAAIYIMLLPELTPPSRHALIDFMLALHFAAAAATFRRHCLDD